MIEFSEEDRVGEGQFADVFRMKDTSRVCKVYRAVGSPKWREWAERISQEEVMAYGLAASNSGLQSYVAACYGAVRVSRVLSARGSDISRRYLLATAFALERVAGEEAKAVCLDRTTYPYVFKLLDALDAAGINAGDSSVFAYERPNTVKFIDITTKLGACIVGEVV